MLTFNRHVSATMLFLMFVGVTQPSWADSISAAMSTNLRAVQGEILPGPGQSSPCWEPGTITYTSDISNCHPLWTNPDTDGSFYAINSYADGTPTSLTFSYDVEENREYSVSTWLASLYRAIDGSRTSVDFLINGILKSTRTIDTNIGGLIPINLNWFSGDSHKAVITLRTSSDVYDGGDWATDAPELDPVPTPEPASMLLLGTGLLGLGSAARRRQIVEKVKPWFIQG